MAESAQIDKIGTWHENLVSFLVANPRMKKSDVARHFDVTPAWLSTVINSDVFKAKLAERQDEYFGAVTTPIREKLENLAGLALDEMEEKVQVEASISEVREVAKLALTSLGYGNGANGKNAQNPALVQQNNFYSVSPEALAAARERILNQGNVIEQDSHHLAAPEAVQAGDGNPMGEALPHPAPVREAPETSGEAPGR